MKRLLLLSILFHLLFFTPIFIYAQDTTSGDSRKAELEKKISEYEKKLTETRQQKNSLSSQIQYMDTQIYLTGLRTQETEKRIESTTNEITVLENRIDRLDTSLNNLSKQLLQRVVEGYKKQPVTFFDVILNSDNANSLMNKMKYYRTAQENNQKILMQVQETKLNFEEQKQIREQKKAQLANLKIELDKKKIELTQQQEAKNKLLAVTQNSENEYQRLLEDARRQVDSYKQFFATTGAGTIPPDGLGTGEGGWYYSQRDTRWAGMRMGSSNESVLDVGCFITSISMVIKSYGNNFTPADIASNGRYFSGGASSGCFPTSWGTAYACVPSTFNGSWPGGLKYKNIGFSQVPDYLGKGIPVIAGVRGSSHYIVLKKMVEGVYIMNDPIYGPDKKVSDYYTISGPFGVFEQ
ncbi:MAG: C39 family peptidase [Candidatus Roizmanbacteria bacterium]